MDNLPCGNFSHSLPYIGKNMSWIYHTISYNQNMSFFGYDEIKMYVNDSHMAASHVVTIKFVIMESPCENRGLCIGELLLNLSVMEHFEKIKGLVLWCLTPLSTIFQL